MIFTGYQIVYIVSLAFACYLFYFLFKQPEKQKSIKALMHFTASAIPWMFFEFLAVSVYIENLSSLLWKISFALAIVMIAFLFRFVLVYCQKKIYRVFYFVVAAACVFVMGLTLFTDKIILKADPQFYEWGHDYIKGDFFFIIALFISIMIVLSFVFFVRRYFEIKDEKEKKSLRIIILSWFITLSVGAASNLFIPLFDINFPKLAAPFALVLIFFTFYAIYEFGTFGIALRKIPIKIRLISAFVLIAVIISSISMFTYYSSTLYSLERRTLDHLETIAEEREYHIKDSYGWNIERLKLISSRTQLRISLRDYIEGGKEKDKDVLSKILLDAVTSNEDFRKISILDKQGGVLVSTDSFLEGKNLSGKKYFKQSPRENNFYILLGEENNPLIYLSGPLFLEGEYLGVVVIEAWPDKFYSILTNEIGLGKTGEVYIIDMQGRLLSPSRFFGKNFFRAEINTENSKNCLKQATGEMESGWHEAVREFKDYRGVDVLGTHIYMPEAGWCLLAEIDKSETLGALRSSIFRLSILIVLAVIAVVGIAGHFVSNSIYRPIKKLHDNVKKVEKGNLDIKVGTEAKDEIGELSRSFDKMVFALKKSRKEIEKEVRKKTAELEKKKEEAEKTSEDLKESRAAIMNILEDVQTEKEKAERQRKRMSIVLQSIGDAVFVVDNEGRINLFNKVAERLTGYEFKEVENQIYSEKLKFVNEKTEEEVEDFVQKALDTKETAHLEDNSVIVNKKGEKIPVADSAAPLHRNGEIFGVVVVLRDVTREREISKMKTEFVSIASHQLRTPLSAIKWLLEMLLEEDAGKINDQQEEFLEQAYDSNERMIKLVNDLLNVSRIEEGRVSIEPEPTNIIKLCKNVLTEIKAKAKEKKHKIEFKKPKKELEKINIDSKLIFQVLMNLLSNAVNYTSAHGKIELGVKKRKKDVMLYVKDNGVGIPKDQQNRVFKKFFRGDNVVKMKTSGTGLGLYVAKSVVESSGGKIWFESEEGKGTTFCFTLPLKGSEPKKGERTLAQVEGKK